jgi:hypothetical protein
MPNVLSAVASAVLYPGSDGGGRRKLKPFIMSCHEMAQVLVVCNIMTLSTVTNVNTATIAVVATSISL